MSKYKGPRIRLVRRLGTIISLTNKKTDRKARPGQHGRNRHKKTQYAKRLLEKQKLRFYYSLTEKQLVSYIKNARTSKRSTSEILFRQLEIRLDNILYRRCLALTLPHARQIVNHSKVKVNRQLVTTPNYFCCVGQTIKTKSYILGVIRKSSTSGPFRQLVVDKTSMTLRQFKRRLEKIQSDTTWVLLSRNNYIWPKHLEKVSSREVKINSNAKRKDVLINFNELLVIEYYSNRLLFLFSSLIFRGF